MTWRTLTVLAFLGMIVASPAFALDLKTARSSGALGEKLDGYVTVLKPSADAEALASEINTRRKQEYGRISQQNSQPIDVVAKLAAQQIISGLDAGSRYQAADGSWKTR